MSSKKKDDNVLMGTCTQIVDGNETIDKMLADSLSIYDQALYFIRQDFFKIDYFNFRIVHFENGFKISKTKSCQSILM